MEEIEALVAVEGRAAGTDAERRASAHLVDRLQSLGRHAWTEPLWVNPGIAPTHLLHAGIAVLGGVVSVSQPTIGFLLLALALASTLLDLSGRAFLVRRLTPRRASQNVVSTEGGEKPGTLVLLAHYDAPRTGAPFSPITQRARASVAGLLGRPLGLVEVFVALLAVSLAAGGVRLAGVESTALTVVQFVPTVALIVCLLLLAGVTVSEVSPGASDNASGVAVALRLAERYGGTLEHFDLWVVLPGAQESGLLGLTRWLREHRHELDPRRTLFVGLNRMGAGTPRYVRREGFLRRRRYHSQLLSLCEELARDRSARAVSRASPSDAYAARRRGFPAVTLSCADERDLTPNYHRFTDTPENVDPVTLQEAEAFGAALIERIDADLGPPVAALDPSSSSDGEVPTQTLPG
jgi:hypothetical protein